MKKLCLVWILLSSLSAYTADQIGINPIFTYGDFQKFDEVVNNTPYIGEMGILDDSSYGYNLQSMRKVYLSLGLQALQSFEIKDGTYGYLSLGLFPTKNTYAKHIIRFATKNELQAYSYELPTNADILERFNIGDAVYWNSLGGVTLNLGLGTFPVAIGPKVGYEGGYSVYVEKKPENKAYVEIRRLNTKTVGFIAGVIISYAERSKLSERTQGISLLIDLNQASGREIYNKVIAEGRIDLAENDPAVKFKIGDVDSLKILNINSRFAIGTPFIPVIEFSKASESEEVLESRSNIWSESSELDQAISRRTRSTRFFGNQNKMETSALVSKKTINKNKSEVTAQLLWERKGNKIQFKHLRNSLNKLIAQTNVQEINMEFPYIRYNLGYAKIALSVIFSNLAIQKISQNSGLKKSSDISRKIQNYWNGPESFSKALELISLCGGELKFEISGESLPRTVKFKNFTSPADCSPEVLLIDP